MQPEIRVRLRLLEKPKGIKCIEEYEFAGYKVCITEDRRYYVYDKITEDPEVALKIAEIEKKIQEMLVSKECTPEEVVSSIEEKYRYIVERQYRGYGPLDPFFRDNNIIDIHVVLGHPAQVVHRKYGKLVSNIELTLDELDRIVRSMGSDAGRIISQLLPIHSFIEPKYEARVTVVYYSDVTLRKGMTVDIRKQPPKPWTILKLIDLRTVSVEEAAYLWLMIKYKVPILIIGELMTGKTVLANAVLNLIPPNSRVITIEDAPELRVYVPYWTRTTTRESETYPISIFSILKIAMRITADYIVIGEIRGEEAREWAQGILLGHGALSTFHAESPEAALLRLTTPPIKVNPQALKLLNIFVKMIPLRGRRQELLRRSELYVYEDDKFTRLFKYDPVNDKIVLSEDAKDPLGFKFLERVSVAHGVPRDKLRKEYEVMVKILGEVYHEAKESDPSLEEPDYKKLPLILYKRLEEELEK